MTGYLYRNHKGYLKDLRRGTSVLAIRDILRFPKVQCAGGAIGQLAGLYPAIVMHPKSLKSKVTCFTPPLAIYCVVVLGRLKVFMNR